MNTKPENEELLQKAFEDWKANPPKPKKTYKKKTEEIYSVFYFPYLPRIPAGHL